jgi:hypothetical protein
MLIPEVAMLTPEALRKLADPELPMSEFWIGNVRQALTWAADTLEAAQKALDECNGVRANGGQ